ncbi:hypothetical protein HNQ07_003136 [Deinococcus metalli]|uniref:Lipoprotein n=1 Tax=Deinococcus metalli TaxID=1141878 RepID=A0A7W8KG73_9DEIO|nr:hypothetical protein [Deinococcus metalli]MBB5377637.1 hypothetical protein [Deinococcus metalli]
MPEVVVKPTLPLVLSAALLLFSCAPATVQTTSGPQTVTVLAGVGLTLSNRVPVEALTGQTPDDAAIIFTACQGGGVSAADVRRVGAEVALRACQQAIQRSADIQSSLPLVMLPVTIVVGYFAVKVFGCLFSFNLNSPSCK